MRISDWSSDVCSSDLQRIADAAPRPGYAESRPWMACGGESGMDACRAGEHAPVGTPLLPQPAPQTACPGRDRKSVERGKSEAVSVDLSGSRSIKKQKQITNYIPTALR